MSEPSDHEWLALRERGEDVSHIPASTRAPYDALASLLAALPGETPSPGWKQRILAALDEVAEPDGSATRPDGPPAGGASRSAPEDTPGLATPRRHRSRRRTWMFVGGLVATAALAVFGLCDRGTVERGERTTSRVAVRASEPAAVETAAVAGSGVTTEIRRGDRPHRSGSDSVSIGDTLVLGATTDRPFELRVYGDTGEPLARCTETQGCAVERDGNIRRFRLELELRASGSVRAVLFTGASIPGGFDNLNADVDAAQHAGGDARQIAVVHVQ